MTAFPHATLSAPRDDGVMTALLPAAATTLDNAARLFERSGAQLLDAASGGKSDAGTAIVGMTQARAQFHVGIALIRFSNEMWDALIDIGAHPRR